MDQVSSKLDDELWEQLKVDFQLEAVGFPDDKIYGRIKVTPESSRRLIKTFKLFLDKNKKSTADLDSNITNLSVSGFNASNKANRSAYIEAMPLKTSEHRENKVTKPRTFFFNGHSFYPNPRITFEPAMRQELPNPAVVIKWHHLGDHKARRYLLYLDDKLIQQMNMRAFTGDELSVGIYDLIVGDRHVLELAATMSREETYRSDPLEFTVLQPSDADVEIINVREDRMPMTLPVTSPPAGEDDEQPEVKTLLPPSPTPPTKPPKTKETSRCCDLAPHASYPGTAHYLHPSSRPPTSSET